MRIELLASAINAVADEMDVVAAKLGNVIALSPTGLLIVCGMLIVFGGMVVWSSHNRKKEE